ncbi:MAG: hypothetical protein LRY73_17280, partial [Bacillus sp. (in: Bacteria)]|nr:hypothetical protein [Bacillus sp. (in: firmicutes)]
MSRLTEKEEIPSEQWRFGYGRHFNVYPDCFSLLYDFCYNQGWIMEEEMLVVGPAWEEGQEL